jgi:hypothetical protein
MTILDGAAIGRSSPVGPSGDPRDVLLAFYPGASVAPMDHVIPTAEPLVARVNHGVWVASCSCGARGLPAPGTVVFLDRLLGWCIRCGNRAWGGGWRPIIAPGPEERRAIERVLLCRPNVDDRNWESGETVADLVAQNREHGDPVPPPDEPPAAAPDEPSPSPFPLAALMASVLGRFGRRGRR